MVNAPNKIDLIKHKLSKVKFVLSRWKMKAIVVIKEIFKIDN